MAIRFNVVYQGQLRPAADEGRFIEEFSQRFGVTAVQARKLMRAGKKVTIKKALPESKAEQLRSELEALGMRVELQPVEGDFPDAPQAAASGETCPKCGSHRVADDSCLDCGIIVSQFKARQAAEAADPYAAPAAGLVDADTAGDLMEPLKLPAGRGWAWITGGFGLFKRNPGIWILIMLVWFLVSIVAGLIPAIGPLAMTLIGPILIGGLMLGAAEQDAGGDLKVAHLFAGFSNNAGQLALVGVIYFGGFLVLGLLMFLIIGGGLGILSGGAMMGEAMGPEQVEMAMLGAWPIILIGVLVAMGLMVPLVMAYWFAPALVVLDDLSAVAAMKLSFMGCLRNIWPFLIYGLAALLLFILAVIPFGLGLLVLSPTLVGSIYVGYREIYFGREAGG